MQPDEAPDEALASLRQSVPVLPVRLAEVSLGGLSPAMGWPGTDTAQRYLAGAYDSVEGLLQAFKTLRVMRAGQQSDSVRRAAGPRPKMLPEPAAFGGTVPV